MAKANARRARANGGADWASMVDIVTAVGPTPSPIVQSENCVTPLSVAKELSDVVGSKQSQP